jgi:hypothetical protein
VSSAVLSAGCAAALDDALAGDALGVGVVVVLP